MTGPLAPTGSQWRLHCGAYAATVVETGGGLRELSHDGRPLVAGYPTDATISGGRGQLLLPWPNRIRDGSYAFGGLDHRLLLSEPARHNAIHGLTRWSSWHLLEQADDTVRLGHRLLAQPGYPWTLDLQVTHRLAAEGLTITVTARNRSATAAPFAAGMHPYLMPLGSVDDCVLTLPAAIRQLTDDRRLPTDLGPVDPSHDFRAGRSIGSARLDDGFTGLVRGADGLARCRVDDVELALDESWRWVQVYTGDDLASAARQAVALEPMTAPADAFNSGVDLTVLEPGASWTGSFRISRAARAVEPSAR